MSEITDNIVIPNIPQFANFINDLRLGLIEKINTEKAKFNLEPIPITSSLEYTINSACSILDANDICRMTLIDGINEYKAVKIENNTTLEDAVGTANFMIADADESRRILIKHIVDTVEKEFPSNATLNDAIARAKQAFLDLLKTIDKVDTSATSASSDSVLDGYDFYNSEYVIETGNIKSMSGGTYTSNQILNTAGKYLTSDIIINVAGGDTREENDTMAKMKSIDFMREELGESTFVERVTEEEYAEQQEFVEELLSCTKSNFTDFVDYTTMNCVNELHKILDFFNIIAPESFTLDQLIALTPIIRIADVEIVEKTGGTQNTTATPDKVKNGRLFYDASGDLVYGSIDVITGRRIGTNQVIPTKNKFVEDDFEISVPANGKNPNETFNEIKTLEMLRYCLGNLSYESIVTDEEYLEQQIYVNDLIYEIQGVRI